MNLNKIFVKSEPKKVMSDRGVEFWNSYLFKVLKKHDIELYTSSNQKIKCGIVKRFDRTLKTRLSKYFTTHNAFRYLDILDNVVKSYNGSTRLTTGYKPIEVDTPLEY